jgi:hypothetical protein
VKRYNMACVFNDLRRCQFGVDNLDKLVLTYTNWANNAILDYNIVQGFVEEFFEAKDILLDDNKQLEDVEDYEKE